ncbi:hypothetical protein FKM82_002401 [Ascaphus truei]
MAISPLTDKATVVRTWYKMFQGTKSSKEAGAWENDRARAPDTHTQRGCGSAMQMSFLGISPYWLQQ